MGFSYIFASIALYLPVAIWGGYFTIVFSLLGLCLAAYWQMRVRVAAEAAILCVVSMGYTIAHLFYTTYSADPVVSSVLNFTELSFVCTQLLLYLIATGRMRSQRQRSVYRWTVRTIFALGCLAIVLLPQASQWLFTQALVASITLAAVFAAVGDVYRSKPFSHSTLFTTLAAIATLFLFAHISYMQAQVPPVFWLLCGIASTAYVGSLGLLITRRFHYLVDLRRATEAGADYDPISRTNLISTLVRKEQEKLLAKREVLSGVLVVVLHNLEEILNTHQRISYNHAQFVLASRLRGLAATTALVGRGPHGKTLPAHSYFVVRRDGIPTRDLYNFAGRAQKHLCQPIDLGFHHLLAESGAEANLWTPHISILAFECGLTELKSRALVESLIQDALKSAKLSSGLGCYNNVGELMAIHH